MLLKIYATASSYPFWIKQNAFLEQPKVLSINNPLTLFEGTNSGQYFAVSNRVVSFKAWNVDDDSDGKPETIWFNLSVPVLSTESINHIRLGFPIQISLSSRFRFTSQALVYVDYSSPISASSVYVDGYLKLVQNDLMTDGLDYAISDSVLQPTWQSTISYYNQRSSRYF
ncbi:hypothetical protein HDV06_001158 [Boothiomyces sp. JEL0866]|nr:hypothetical protein HDV06_001158 [Boothiomyces sp. JEL0866]